MPNPPHEKRLLRDVPSRFAKVRLRAGLMLNPSGFLMDPRSAETYTVNAAGACLITALQRGVSADDLYLQLCARFHVPEAVAHRDTHQFLVALAQQKLLEVPAERRPTPPHKGNATKASAAHG